MSDYDMEISSEKSKTMVNSRDESSNIRMNGAILEEVNKFKYLGVTITKYGTSEVDLRIRLVISTSALIRLQTIWTSKKIGFKTLLLSILLYGCEAWTITKRLRTKMQAFENKAHRLVLDVNYREHKTNIYIKENINSYFGKFTPLLSIINKKSSVSLATYQVRIHSL